MRFLSMIRVEEREGQAPSERLMKDMGTLIEEMTRDGSLVRTAGLRPTKEGKRMRWNRGALSAVDGPFTETKEVIAGFAILEAKSMTDALALTKRFLEIHGDEWNLECEVRQIEQVEFGCEGQVERDPVAPAIAVSNQQESEVSETTADPTDSIAGSAR